MNTNTEGGRTSTFARRAVPALAIVVLAIGLGACQTPRGEAVQQAPVVQQADRAPVKADRPPVGIQLGRPADRIAEEIARQALGPATSFPSWTARITAEVEYQVQLSQQPSVRFRGMTADRIVEQLAKEQDRFKGMTADRIVEQLDREAHGTPVLY
jgi:hypothetical protein